MADTLFILLFYRNDGSLRRLRFFEILIVAGATFDLDAASVDLPGLYQIFVNTLGQASGTIFALSLLFSGSSAGIVATMAGQISVKEL